MSKLRATRAQVIAAAIIVVLAVVLGGVGLYGMNARGSENGAQVLENMRLQAILNTAGSGAVDAYVAAAKSEASTKARESGGGMSAVREAAAKAEEDIISILLNYPDKIDKIEKIVSDDDFITDFNLVHIFFTPYTDIFS